LAKLFAYCCDSVQKCRPPNDDWVRSFIEPDQGTEMINNKMKLHILCYFVIDCLGAFF